MSMSKCQPKIALVFNNAISLDPALLNHSSSNGSSGRERIKFTRPSVEAPPIKSPELQLCSIVPDNIT